MPRREGEQRVEHLQSVSVAVARGLDGGEIDVGVGEARIELDRPARHGLGAVVFALVVEQIGKVAVGLGVVGLERERRVPALLRLRREAEALEGVGEIVERLGVVRARARAPARGRAGSRRASASPAGRCRDCSRRRRSSGASATARRPACSPSASSPFWRHISAKSLK